MKHTSDYYNELSPNDFWDIGERAFDLRLNMDKASPEEMKKTCIRAREIVDECFAAVQKQGFWMTKNLELIPFKDLSAEHVWMILSMWKRRYVARAAETVKFYLTCPIPNGEMAQEAYEQEASYWAGDGAEEGWKLLMQEEPAYEALMKRAKKLGLPIKDWRP